MAEKAQYGQEIVFEEVEVIREEKTEHAEIRYVGTRNHGNVLLMNGEVQFSSADEHRYHETLVHPAMSSLSGYDNINVLILGGGDGLAAREVVKWTNVSAVTIVDFDTEFVNQFGKRQFSKLNNHVFERTNVVKYASVDARIFTRNRHGYFDAIFIDLPDPDDKLSVLLYLDCIENIRPMMTCNCAVAVHTGPVHPNPEFSHWKTVEALRAALREASRGKTCSIELGSVYVPSFGNEWGILTMTSNVSTANESLIQQVEQSCKYWSRGFEKPPKDISRIFHNT